MIAKEKPNYFDINSISENFEKNYLSNIADKCVNYNKDENHHFKPYFLCEICNIQFCYNCICSHLENYIKDNKHNNIKSIISEKSINFDIYNAYNEILNKRKNIISKMESHENEIELKKNKLLEMKDIINKNINLLENNYTKILEDIKNLETNEKYYIQEILTKIYKILNCNNKAYNNRDIDNDNLDQLYNNMNLVNNAKNIFDEKLSQISDYFDKINNNLYDMKKSNLNNMRQLINDLYKNELNEECGFSPNNNGNLEIKFLNRKKMRSKSKESQEIEKKKDKQEKKEDGEETYEEEEDEEEEDEEEEKKDNENDNDEDDKDNKDLNNKKTAKFEFVEKTSNNNVKNNIIPYNSLNKNCSLNNDSKLYSKNSSINSYNKDIENDMIIENKNHIFQQNNQNEEIISYIDKIASFKFDNKNLTSKDLKLIDNDHQKIENNYLLNYIPKSEKINVFSIKEKRLFLCDYKIENMANNFIIKYILNSNNFKTISINDCLYIVGAKFEGIKKIKDMVKKKVCKIKYSINENICSIEILNETNFNRKNCSIIYCKSFNIIICVGGEGGRGNGHLKSSEFLDLSRESQGWINFEKKTNNSVIDGKLFILNDTKLFLIGGFMSGYKNNYNCEMLDINEELINIKSNKISDTIDECWTLIKLYNNNFKIERNAGLFNIKYLDEERIVIFGGEKDKPSNRSAYFILEYDELEKEIICKKSNLNHLNISQFIFIQNFVTVDNLIVLPDEDKSNKLPLMCNFDYKGNLWILYQNKLRNFI